MLRLRRLLLPGLMLVAVLCVDLALGRTARARPIYDLAGYGYEKGNAKAQVVLIEFADFGCTACAAFTRETLPRLEREWIATGRARLRVIPIDVLRSGRLAARAGLCAAEQGKFWPMQNLLFLQQRAWLGKRGQHDKFEEFALKIGVDTSRFRTCWKNEENSIRLIRNTELARLHGVPGTPAFLVNGKPAVGALPYAFFSAALDSAAARRSAAH